MCSYVVTLFWCFWCSVNIFSLSILFRACIISKWNDVDASFADNLAYNLKLFKKFIYFFCVKTTAFIYGLYGARAHIDWSNTRIHICFVRAQREQQLKELHHDDENDDRRSVILYKRNGIIYASGIILRPAHT